MEGDTDKLSIAYLEKGEIIPHRKCPMSAKLAASHTGVSEDTGVVSKKTKVVLVT